jgi:hypothetical protein
MLRRRTASYQRGEAVLKLAKSIILFITIASVAVLTLANAKESPDSFSGKWVLDKRSPRPGDAPNSLETKIKQDNSGLTIESTFREPDNGVLPLLYLGVMAEKVRLTTDGHEEQQQIGPFMATFKSTMDGNKLTTEWAALIKGDQVQGQWVHTLSGDGKHMTLDIQERSTHGQHAEATLQFVRK